MGIPRFAKTLMTRYPLIIGNIRTESDIPIIHNLYLDLNSTIHELSHSNPDNILALLKNKSYEQIYQETCDIINQIVQLIKPKSLLVIALDGVSPIAKISDQLKSRYSKYFLANNQEINDLITNLNLDKKNNFDKNEISPCTNFMINLEKYIDNYILQKKKENADIWKDINIIFSGTNVPGEGEYKIMEIMREEKIKDEKKIINHCIFSNDADFILLSLLCHEANIVLLKKGTSNKKEYNFESTKKNNFLNFNEFLYISVLREYLDIEFCKLKSKIKFEYNIEKLCDDFSFLCFLYGNDFLPSLLSLDNDGNVFEFVINSYKNSLIKFNDYLTNNGLINFSNFKIFMNDLSMKESEYFNEKSDFFKRILLSRKNNHIFNTSLFDIYKEENSLNKDNNIKVDKYERLKKIINKSDTLVKKINNINDMEIIKRDEEFGKDLNDFFINKFVEEYNNDKYKGKIMYYQEKFNIDIEDNEGKKELNKIILNYIEGLQWNLLYFKGYLSWNWNYLYNYCPLISNIAKFNFDKNQNEIINNNIFQLKGEPIPPYILQCLIFPSFDLIPVNYHKIKEIIPEYYSFKKKFDNDGSPFPSQYIVTCPKISGNKTIQDLIQFDSIEFSKTENYTKIKESYGKEYLYNISNEKSLYIHKRKNEIFEEKYNINKTDILFPSIEKIKNYKYIEGYFNRCIGKNKIIQINSLFIYISLDEKKYKKINKIIIDEILKEKIISYGYPHLKIGYLTGVYFNNKYYSKNAENSYLIDYEEMIKKDYEYIGLKILDLSILIEVVPLLFIGNDKIEFDYEYKYLIPLEITSVNKTNDIYREYLKNILKINNVNEEEIKLDEEKLKKDREIFLYDNSIKKNKSEIKDKIKINDKNKYKGKNNDKKRKKPIGPAIEREIINFKFKNIDDYY